MKRFALGCVAVILVLLAVALGFWWMVPKQAGGDLLSSTKNVDMKSSTFYLRASGGGLDFNGKKMGFTIGGDEAKDLDVEFVGTTKFKDGQVDATIQVRIKSDRPPVLTKEAYDKIQIGMTYPQVGEIPGGAMIKGKLSDGFSSKLQLTRGEQQIDLTFVDGKVAEKSAKGVE